MTYSFLVLSLKAVAETYVNDQYFKDVYGISDQHNKIYLATKGTLDYDGKHQLITGFIVDNAAEIKNLQKSLEVRWRKEIMRCRMEK